MLIKFVQSNKDLEQWREVLDSNPTGAPDGFFPRGVWISPPGLDNTFTVLDNNDGHAWLEKFDTIDGALMYALGIKYLGSGPQSEWDKPGALKEHWNFKGKDEIKEG